MSAVLRRPRALLTFRPETEPWLLTPGTRARLESLVEVVVTLREGEDWRPHATRLGDVEVVIGNWGVPRFTPELLATMPALRIVCYAAGSVRGFVTPEFWQRGIQLTTAVAANARATATCAEAMIILSLKQVWFHLREPRAEWAQLGDTASSGVHRATVGIIGLSRVGREVVRGLQRHELRLLVYDPTIDAAEACRVGVELAALPELFAASHVVSVHAPQLPATTGLVTGELLRRMGPHTTFVNTARGAIVREAELVAVLRARPDLTAVLDVTEPEPAPADSPLRALPNVVLTPHLAGARHRDLELLMRSALDELERHLRGEPLQFALTEAAAALQA
ncbi:hydroxyacid dehydrogenase [Oleiharenicola lentus]|uniref:Hydroxyacid dehydrogenase n=1 Tax=Oleiharenicola lentus TaxID=2508720 RepID=A0A4Q1C9Y6_9BACT|nr:hydroxyacid dehydrogenase [Oleiharenicola lentus]RXK55877.1 hydroxyacid dehydrogenase [Oleiharenicola lentus]